MRFIIIFLLLTKSNCSLSQSIPPDSIDYYIQKLNWNSFDFTPTYFRTIVLSNMAERLVSLEKKDAVAKLLTRITDSEKTVAIHIILTNIYEPQNAYLKTSYQYQDNKLIKVFYSVNELNWEEDVNERYMITENEIKKIKAYWEQKLSFLKERSLEKSSAP